MVRGGPKCNSPLQNRVSPSRNCKRERGQRRSRDCKRPILKGLFTIWRNGSVVAHRAGMPNAVAAEHRYTLDDGLGFRSLERHATYGTVEALQVAPVLTADPAVEQ